MLKIWMWVLVVFIVWWNARTHLYYVVIIMVIYYDCIIIYNNGIIGCVYYYVVRQFSVFLLFPFDIESSLVITYMHNICKIDWILFFLHFQEWRKKQIIYLAIIEIENWLFEMDKMSCLLGKLISNWLVHSIYKICFCNKNHTQFDGSDSE